MRSWRQPRRLFGVRCGCRTACLTRQSLSHSVCWNPFPAPVLGGHSRFCSTRYGSRLHTHACDCSGHTQHATADAVKPAAAGNAREASSGVLCGGNHSVRTCRSILSSAPVVLRKFRDTVGRSGQKPTCTNVRRQWEAMHHPHATTLFQMCHITNANAPLLTAARTRCA